MTARTLYDKLWDSHLVHQEAGGTALIYIDRHLVHEVTSPQAYEGLKLAGRQQWRVDSVVATADHNTPTRRWERGIAGIEDPVSRLQVETLDANIKEFGAKVYFPFLDRQQGIVHVIGPEQGATLPGMTLVCGDSHTSTHGALGCLAFGIGTSEVEHVLATQCMVMKKSKTMRIDVEGELGFGVAAKDVILAIIGEIGSAGGTGYAIEYSGSCIRGLSMEGRMTICNMSIEAGARAGMVAVDDKTLAYVKGRPFAPSGGMWDRAVGYWRTLVSDAGARFDKLVKLDAASILPQVTWGTNPQMVATVDGRVPDPAAEADPVQREWMQRALKYMALEPGTPITEIRPNKVFIGACTNSRIEDLRAAAEVARGKRVAASIDLAIVVPGSGLVKRQAEEEGLDKVFAAAGFEWREPGCSMCLGMNDDLLSPGDRCASTSNRNFEGRQGPGGRTHLVSPAMAAAAAIAGHFVDVRNHG